MMDPLLTTYKKEVDEELKAILSYWTTHTQDLEWGGFVGRIDNGNNIYPLAPKGSVLNSRILWTFSAAYTQVRDPAYQSMADRAYRYLTEHLLDKTWGGVYWTVDHTGRPLNRKKQVYAIAFAIYGISEYAAATKNREATDAAIALYRCIEAYSYDSVQGGYLEALSEDWQPLDDLRLSDKDANESKSMNTHLHVLEAYANLYRIWPDGTLKNKIVALVRLFLQQIRSVEGDHLTLFFDERWNPRSNTISFGHDIEAAWLVQEAAELVDDGALLCQVKAFSLVLARAVLKEVDTDGGLWYEYSPEQQRMIRQKHWWPQAEAMVGFFNAWQLGGEQTFLDHAVGSWAFIKKQLLAANGEWYWGVEKDGSVMAEDKAGLWKCPYHNGRACMQISKRIERVCNEAG